MLGKSLGISTVRLFDDVLTGATVRTIETTMDPMFSSLREESTPGQTLLKHRPYILMQYWQCAHVVHVHCFCGILYQAISIHSSWYFGFIQDKYTTE
jgi:hypothetical protein